MKCKIPTCLKCVAAEQTNDGRRSKLFCLDHSTSKFLLPCPKCGDSVSLLPSSYVKRLENNNWTCSRCHRIKNAEKYRGSEAQMKHLSNLHKSGAIKAYYQNPNNEKAIKEKMLNHNRSPVMIESSKRLAEKYFKPYRESDEFKDHILKHNRSDKMRKISSETGKNSIKNINKRFNDLFKNLNVDLSMIVDDVEIDASYESFKVFDDIPGVWAKYGMKDGKEYCLDVAQTNNVGKEMKWSFRALISQKLDKYKNMSEFSSIKFILVKGNLHDKRERLLLEALYAIKNKALFWKPEFTQKSLNFNEYLNHLNSNITF